jgi:hypothetical protein
VAAHDTAEVAALRAALAEAEARQAEAEAERIEALTAVMTLSSEKRRLQAQLQGTQQQKQQLESLLLLGTGESAGRHAQGACWTASSRSLQLLLACCCQTPGRDAA